ncbi:PREDICTED: uncharacterized protein LOC104806480 isoform X2 [Tarenaya hassleriana]|uniref:uncharacterized protein LOC104806480 isoform X2 n=1 Tax=Tarenaya hassleriana TaxID=28532 RepID=UPI00053C1B8B|nr:PREDICTED: uncharacterized protein LOC104806480 isoform X2 [Tarenaya hassleriana]
MQREFRLRSRAKGSLFPSLHGSSEPRCGFCGQSGSRTERRRTAEIRCVVCGGAGKVDCHNCNGKGRTNCVHLEMLPRGEWPRWCKSCGGSGLGYCSRCLGTGEFRHPMGFRFLNRQEDDRQ